MTDASQEPVRCHVWPAKFVQIRHTLMSCQRWVFFKPLLPGSLWSGYSNQAVGGRNSPGLPETSIHTLSPFPRWPENEVKPAVKQMKSMIFPRRRNNVKCIRSTPLQERVRLTSSVEVLIIVPGSGQPKQKIPILLPHKLISLSFCTLCSSFLLLPSLESSARLYKASALEKRWAVTDNYCLG